MGREGVPLRRGSLSGDAEVSSVNSHHSVVEHVVRAQSALEDDLRLRGRQRGGGGGKDQMLGKKYICVD
jgi:hypothetical protein